MLKLKFNYHLSFATSIPLASHCAATTRRTLDTHTQNARFRSSGSVLEQHPTLDDKKYGSFFRHTYGTPQRPARMREREREKTRTLVNVWTAWEPQKNSRKFCT